MFFIKKHNLPFNNVCHLCYWFNNGALNWETKSTQALYYKKVLFLGELFRYKMFLSLILSILCQISLKEWKFPSSLLFMRKLTRGYMICFPSNNGTIIWFQNEWLEWVWK
jgi:hypothetical protein